MRKPILSIRDDASVGESADAVAAVQPEPGAVTLVSRFPADADCGPDEDRVEWNTIEFFEAATVEAVRERLANGADPNARDENGWTPMHFVAAVNADPAIVVVLLEAGANPNARGKGGRTPLFLAAAYATAAAVDLLLVAGANPKARNSRGSTPMHSATFRKCGESLGIVIALLRAHADPNAQTAGGWTPLHGAALNGTPAVVDALLNAGADPTASASWMSARARVTPWDLAQENSSLQGADAFRRLAGRKPGPFWLRGLGLIKFAAMFGFRGGDAGAGISPEPRTLESSP